MPDVIRCLRCEYSCAYLLPIARTRLRVHWAPGIPRALCDLRAVISGTTRAQRVARSRMRRVGKAAGARECARRLRAHHSMQEVGTARDAPLPTLRLRWIASLALAMTVPRLNWLFDNQIRKQAMGFANGSTRPTPLRAFPDHAPGPVTRLAVRVIGPDAAREKPLRQVHRRLMMRVAEYWKLRMAPRR